MLAGGRGSRLGGGKPAAALAGRPLLAHSSAAPQAAGLHTVVVAKARTGLPQHECELLLEPDEPVHPLLGIVTALRRWPAVVALACDMPFVEPALLAWLAAAPAECVVAQAERGVQPFPGLYRASALPVLERALGEQRSLRSAIAELDAVTFDAARFGDPARILYTVNTPAELAAAEALSRSSPRSPAAP